MLPYRVSTSEVGADTFITVDHILSDCQSVRVYSCVIVNVSFPDVPAHIVSGNSFTDVYLPSFSLAYSIPEVLPQNRANKLTGGPCHVQTVAVHQRDRSPSINQFDWLMD